MTDDAAASMEPKVQETERKRKFVGFSEQLEMKRRERDRRNKPRSWVERKLVVPIVFGIVGYAWYVYIGRFCVPMLRRDMGAMGGRGMGVAFTVVFCLLGVMFWWSYIKLLFTSPGFAKDFVQKTPAPQGEGRRGHGRATPSASHSHGHSSDSEGWDSDEEYVGGTPYAEISPPATRPPKNEGPSTQNPLADVEKRAGLNIPSAPHRPPAPVARTVSSPKRTHSSGRTPLQVTPKNGTSDTHGHSGGERNTYETAVSGPQYATNASALPHPLAKQIDEIQPSSSSESQPPHNSRNVEEGLPPPMYSRRPPTYPALLPEYRYCYTDGLVKPMRAHHCRVCGTCVLMFDHHCPWIGQCVGALNHKFFVNFLQWSTPWTLWIFASLVALQAKTVSDSGSDVDPQIIVIIALSALFSLFTSVLLAAHIRMIVLNQSNVEALSVSSMRERERAILGRMVPLSDWRRRNVLRKEWDAEWGKLNTEGNMWWLESAYANWEYRMGKNRWGWFLPIGKSEGDGQTYPVNPRFDADGRWRRRSEWPPELR